MIIMASNAFYSFYLAHVRFYPLLVLLSTLVIWLYLRIAILERSERRSDYVALAVACAALVSTHAFGILLYIVCSLYHLLFVRKNRRWLAVPAAAVSGLALAGPLIFVMFTNGVDFAVAGHGPRADGLGDILAAWLNVTANGNPLLLLLAAAGAALGWRQTCGALRRCAILFVLLLLAIALAAVGSGTLKCRLDAAFTCGSAHRSPVSSCRAICLVSQAKTAGSASVPLGNRGPIIRGVSRLVAVHPQDEHAVIDLPPWHLVSRTAEQSGDAAHVIAFALPDSMMWTTPWGPVGLREHWFDRRDIEFRWVGAVKWLEEYLRLYRGSGISPWVVYQKSRTDDAQLAELETTMDELGYQACQRVSLPITTEMVQYSWISLDCLPAKLSVSNQVEPLRYQFYGAKLAADGSRLFFANKRTSPSQDTLDRLQISHQLISENWENVGQLDLPLAPTEELHQFAIDVSEIPPGLYRLMAIVYDRHSGKTLDWQEAPGNPPSMLFLREVEIR